MTIPPEHREGAASLLKLATDAGKFGLQVGMVLPEHEQSALEWLQVNGFVTLLDVTPVAAARSVALFRVFKVSLDVLAALAH